MNHDKFLQQLELLLLLAENRTLTVQAMASRMGVTQRTVYYYLRAFQRPEFGLVKRGAGVYSIPREAPWVARLCGVVKFTEEELVTLRRVLSTADGQDPVAVSLLGKLERFYDLRILSPVEGSESEARRASLLYRAIREERTAVLHRYRSAHSGTVRDRLVEPFRLLNGNRDVRALDLETRECKTFRISRMDDVTVYDAPWIHPELHRDIFCDLFNFASEEPWPVALRLDTLSRDVLCEEHPRAELYITPEGGGEAGDRCARWLLEADVCSPVGVGRFVMGLYDHVEIVRGERLRAYVRDELRRFADMAAGREGAETE